MWVKQLLGTKAYISLCQPTGHAGRTSCSVHCLLGGWKVLMCCFLRVRTEAICSFSEVLFYDFATEVLALTSLKKKHPLQHAWTVELTKSHHLFVMQWYQWSDYTTPPPPQCPTPPLSTAKGLNHTLHCHSKTVTSMLMNHQKVILA